ncbi:hypothetical protein K2173_026444 [Erythroxylum novogranatense]|uniref:UDP-N-acetylglucosamine--peptide N-acetylglucosaminyltransferase SPINDLY n=1 Tax=Erythroxylum novogranatense TaxID=1862640 RepID=A0AAV8TW92_9ROSI|nr:hypothetical protein K2173_026444 [Erythroxylum novogranatense]
MSEPPVVSISVKSEPVTGGSITDECSKTAQPVVLADLNANPPETDGNQLGDKNSLKCKDGDMMVVEVKKSNKSGKCRSRNNRLEGFLDYGADGDDQSGLGPSSSREEKVSSLKTGLVQVARKMPKNAHVHFMLGLMYQRMGQPQKAVWAYEKAEEILLRCEAEVSRPDLLSLVQIHHAQCILLENSADNVKDKELDAEEIEDILSKLKESMQLDVRRASVWNTLGLLLVKSGRLQSAISVLSAVLSFDPNNYDCLANLGIAYLLSGNSDLPGKCFQDVILKDQNHPTALINYAALLLSKSGSVVAGAGAHAGQGASSEQFEAVNVAKECLLAALKVDPRAPHTWANLAYAYYMTGDHKSSGKCLEKAVKLEPNCMSTRYAVAVHRIKDAERSQDPSEQLFWAGNEMASILREGDSVPIDLPIAWAGLAMVHKAQHEIAAAFDTEQKRLMEVEEHAHLSLKQAIVEDPDDGVQWNQLGLHYLCSRQFKTAQKYLKISVARMKDCSYAWSNLGISLQLSEESSQAEDVYKRALACATTEQAHAIFSNLGNLYRQQNQYDRAKAMFAKSLELQPGYAPAFNNLGLVFIAEHKWEEAKFCFDKALQADPLLDAAKSNMIKAVAMSKLSCGLSCIPHS